MHELLSRAEQQNCPIRIQLQHESQHVLDAKNKL